MFKSIKDTLDKGVAAVSVKSESIVESSRVRRSEERRVGKEC